MTSQTDPSPSRIRRRWLMPAFLASLALNLLIAGIVVGWAASHRPDARGHDMRAFLGAPFVRALPDDDRRELLRRVMERRGDPRGSRENVRARFEALLQALRADPFDRTAIEEIFTEQAASGRQRQALGEELLLDRLSAMTAAERAAYADRLAETLRRVRRD